MDKEALIQRAIEKFYLEERDVLRENGHAFVDVAKLRLSMEGKSCVLCGVMGRRGGTNVPCVGVVRVGLRNAIPPPLS